MSAPACSEIIRDRTNGLSRRGVWWFGAVFPGGVILCIATDGNGQVVASQSVAASAAEAYVLRVEAALWAALDALDPVQPRPRLEVLR